MSPLLHSVFCKLLCSSLSLSLSTRIFQHSLCNIQCRCHFMLPTSSCFRNSLRIVCCKIVLLLSQLLSQLRCLLPTALAVLLLKQAFFSFGNFPCLPFIPHLFEHAVWRRSEQLPCFFWGPHVKCFLYTIFAILNLLFYSYLMSFQ